MYAYGVNFSFFVIIHSRHDRQMTDRRHLMGIAELAMQLRRSAKNRPTFAKVMPKTGVTSFFDSQCTLPYRSGQRTHQDISCKEMRLYQLHQETLLRTD